MMRIRFVLMVLGLVSGLALSGCGNTVDGMGRDIEKAGRTIQKTF